MNHDRDEALRQRQWALLLRSAELRSTLVLQTEVLRTPLALADQVRSLWRWLWAHPEWPLGAVVVVAVLRPRRALRWATWGWTSWRLWRRWQAQLSGLMVAGRRDR